MPDFHSKLLGIQNVMPRDEVPELFRTLKAAYDDRLNGSSGVFTFNRIDGSSVRFLIQFFYLNEDCEQRRFYGSARDITEIMNLQRHVELLSRFTSRTVLFLLYYRGRYSFEAAAHGLEKEMGLTRQELEEELNTEQFYKRLILLDECILWKLALNCAEQHENSEAEFTMRGAEGKVLNMLVEADCVAEGSGDVRCILAMRKK